MKLRLLALFTLLGLTGNAQHYLKKDPASRFTIGAGLELFHFYTIQPPGSGGGVSLGYLPLRACVDFRANMVEFDDRRSLSLSFTPTSGVSILNGSGGPMAITDLPLFLRYNANFTATPRSGTEKGYSIGIGPSLILFYFPHPAHSANYNVISINAQFTRHKLSESGHVRFTYLRMGYEPAGYGYKYPGFNVSIGRGWTF